MDKKRAYTIQRKNESEARYKKQLDEYLKTKSNPEYMASIIIELQRIDSDLFNANELDLLFPGFKKPDKSPIPIYDPLQNCNNCCKKLKETEKFNERFIVGKHKFILCRDCINELKNREA